MEKEFLNVKDVAKILQITERKTRDLFNKGELKGKKVGNKYVTTINLLKNYIERG